MSSFDTPEAQISVAPPPFNGVDVFATSPQSLDCTADTYLQQVIDVARWSEVAGCTGTLVYTDNGIVDPWVVAQAILAHTERLVPLVAVQPLYLHPYSAAKMVASLGYLYGRRINLNMVAGGFKNDLVSLGDTTPHDRRYDRLIEYVQVIQLLLASEARPVTYRGEFYQLENAILKPSLPSYLLPQFFISGSSPAGVAAAQAVGAIAVKYPEPPGDATAPAAAADSGLRSGVRLGIIARDSAVEAWEVANRQFPFDRKGQLMHQMAMRVSDSVWHKQLSTRSGEAPSTGTYWLGPFEISKSNCPYLVGSYTAVTQDLLRYMQLGFETFILDIPPSSAELRHVQTVFAHATALATIGVRP